MLWTLIDDPATGSRLVRVLQWPLRVGTLIALLYAIVITPPGIGLHGTGATALVGSVLSAVGWLGWGAVQERSDWVRVVPLVGYTVGGAILVQASRSGIGFAFICVAVLVAAGRLPLRFALGVAGVAVLALVGAAMWESNPRDLLVGLIALTSSFMGGLLRHQRQERLEQAELLIAETQVAKEEQARAAALAERTRLAREIHDVLAHSLGALSVQLEAADALLADVPAAERARQCVDRARGLAREGLAETRRAVAALRGHGRPLQDSLTELADRYRSDSGAVVTVALPADLPDLPPDLTLALHRLAQEALTNVRRYAADATVDIRLTRQRDQLNLSVHNGYSPAAGDRATPSQVGGGFGLTGLRERLELLGGTVTAEVDGVGWTVTATAPVPPDPPRRAPVGQSPEDEPSTGRRIRAGQRTDQPAGRQNGVTG